MLSNHEASEGHEGAVLELDEILSACYLRSLCAVQAETQFAQRCDECGAVLPCLFGEQVCILGRVWKAEEDSARLAEKKITDAVPLEAVPDFLRLTIFKRAHSPANPAGSPRTSAGSPRSFQKREKGSRPLRVCRCG